MKSKGGRAVRVLIQTDPHRIIRTRLISCVHFGVNKSICSMFKLRYLINDFAQAISKLHLLEFESATTGPY